MKRWFVMVLSACLLWVTALPAAAQESGLRLEARQAGVLREYGVFVTLEPSVRTKKYTYELLEGETVLSIREQVEDSACFLPIPDIDAGIPQSYTVRVTANPMPERAGLDRPATIKQEFSTAKGCSCTGADRFQVGSGTEGDPYLIGTLGQLLHINQHTGQKLCYMQTADIVFGDHNTATQVMLNTASVYDGNGHVIRDGSIRNTAAQGSAQVFRIVAGTLRNLGFEEMTFFGDFGAGPISTNGAAAVECCYGKNINASAANHTGALAHWNEGRIENCYTVGGQLTTTANGSYGAGGITGCLVGSSQLDKAYAMPAKLTAPKTAGIAAYIRGGSVKNSFYLKGVASYGALPGNDNINAAPLEAPEFADQSRFEEAGWDFETVWVMGQVTYRDAAGGAVMMEAPVLRVFAGG